MDPRRSGCGVVKNLRGQGRLTEANIQDALREVRVALLEAEVALPVVRDFIAKVKDKAMGQDVLHSLTPGQMLIGVVHKELTALMGEQAAPLDFASQPPAVFLMAGLQGAGKTTTCGKLVRLMRERGKKKVLLVSTDVYRPAAIDQLKTVAGQAEADFFPSDPRQKPVEIARAALDHAGRDFHDVLIVDTAGRLHVDAAMMCRGGRDGDRLGCDELRHRGSRLRTTGPSRHSSLLHQACHGVRHGDPSGPAQRQLRAPARR